MRSNGLPHASTAPPGRRRPALGKRSRVEANNSALEGRTHDGIDQKVLLSALTALKKGNFSVRLPVEWTGIAGRISDALNDVIELNEKMARELERLSRVVGKEGKITHRAELGGFSGAWGASLGSVNALIGDLVHPTSETARVIGAVARGDLSQAMALDLDDRPLQGEFLRSAKTVNLMVDQLRSFASEVTRVAREVGTEGKLGGQADVKGVAGTSKDLTDSVSARERRLDRSGPTVRAAGPRSAPTAPWPR